MDISLDQHCESVFGDENLLQEILVRVSSKKAVIRSTAVHRKWKEAVKAEHFVDKYTYHHEPCLMGFMVQFESLYGKMFQMFDAEKTPANETVATLGALMDRRSLESDIIVGSRFGFVLTVNRLNPSGYSVSCPSFEPKIYSQVAPPLPAIPRLPNQHTDNTLGQFAIIPHAGPAGMAFFARDRAPNCRRSCRGITFASGSPAIVHVSVYSNRDWHRFFSKPIKLPGIVTFHKHPYCILGKKHLFILYIVGVPVSFDLEHNSFSLVQLPEPMNDEVVSEMQYHVSGNPDGGITLVYLHRGVLFNWKLQDEVRKSEWTFVSSTDLVSIFVEKFGDETRSRLTIPDEVQIGDIDYHYIQIRCVWSEGQFIMLSIGFDGGLLILDTAKSTLTQIDNIRPVGRVGHVFTLTEPWPPIF